MNQRATCKRCATGDYIVKLDGDDIGRVFRDEGRSRGDWVPCWRIPDTDDFEHLGNTALRKTAVARLVARQCRIAPAAAEVMA